VGLDEWVGLEILVGKLLVSGEGFVIVDAEQVV
jgi:hypothetical protein